jgi:hypothetical protein
MRQLVVAAAVLVLLLIVLSTVSMELQPAILPHPQVESNPLVVSLVTWWMLGCSWF